MVFQMTFCVSCPSHSPFLILLSHPLPLFNILVIFSLYLHILSPKWDIFVNTWTQGTSQKKGRRNIRTRECAKLSSGHDMATAQEQSLHSSLDVRRDHETEELLVTDGCQRTVISFFFFLEVWPLIGCLYPTVWPYTHMYTESLIRLSGLHKKRIYK